MSEMRHSHHHPHEHRHDNQKKLWGVLLLSGSYMIAEVVGGLVSGSLALIADAGHMAIDTAAVGLGVFALWIAHKPPTEQKTYGYYRAEILAALANGAALVAVAFWIFSEAWSRFHNPSPIRGEMMTLIAAGGLFVNCISLWVMHSRHHQNLNMRSVWLHLVSDTLGSVGALTAAFLVWKFNWYLADSIVSLFIGTLILVGSWNLLSECVNVLLEGVPKGIKICDIKTRLESMPNVRDVHDLHVWTVTSGVPALSAHVGVDEDADHAKVLRELTTMLSKEFKIDHVTVQLDPPNFSHRALHF